MNIRPSLFALVLTLSISFAENASAIPPRTHSIRGEVVGINPDAGSFVIRDERTHAESTIRWKAHSRFFAGGRAGPCCLSTGIVAKVSFRREVGEKVAREVRWSNAACE